MIYIHMEYLQSTKYTDSNYSLLATKGAPKQLKKHMLHDDFIESKDRIVDVSLVAPLQEVPNMKQINAANRGCVTNRIILTHVHSKRRLFLKLDRPDWMMQKLAKVQEKRMIAVPVLLLLRSNKNNTRSLYVMIHDKDQDPRLPSDYKEKIIEILEAIHEEILMGNVFNPSKIASLQIYDFVFYESQKGGTRFYNISNTDSCRHQDEYRDMLTELFKASLEKRLKLPSDFQRYTLSNGFNFLPGNEVIHWKVRGEDKLYYLLDTGIVSMYIRPLFRKIMRKYGFRNIGPGIKYLPEKIKTSEFTYPSPRHLANASVYGPSSSDYGVHGDKLFSKNDTNWPWISTMRGSFLSLSDKKDIYNFVYKYDRKSIPDIGSPDDSLSAKMPYGITLDTGVLNLKKYKKTTDYNKAPLAEKQALRAKMKAFVQTAKDSLYKGKTTEEILKNYMFGNRDYDWIFKPALGAQGKGIFVQYKLKNPDDAQELEDTLDSVLDTIIGVRIKEPDYKEWIINQFIGKPLLFRPFYFPTAIQEFYQIKAPDNYTKATLKEDAEFHAHHKHSKSAIAKYNAQTLLGVDRPDGKLGIGHKSHLRFYMVVRQEKLDNYMHYYVYPQAVIILAAEPYSICVNKYFKKNIFDPERTQMCNQSNLTKDGIYYEDNIKLLKRLFKKHASDGGKDDPHANMYVNKQDADTDEDEEASHDEDSHDEDDHEAFHYEKNRDCGCPGDLESKKIAAKTLSALADQAFDRRYGRGFYKKHIYPQIVDIAKMLVSIIEKTNRPMSRCANSSFKEYLGCSQILAIDVLFTDGSERKDGIPHGWLLEANTRPGLGTPTSHGITEDLLESILPYMNDRTVQDIQKDLEKVDKKLRLLSTQDK